MTTPATGLKRNGLPVQARVVCDESDIASSTILERLEALVISAMETSLGKDVHICSELVRLRDSRGQTGVVLPGVKALTVLLREGQGYVCDTHLSSEFVKQVISRVDTLMGSSTHLRIEREDFPGIEAVGPHGSPIGMVVYIPDSQYHLRLYTFTETGETYVPSTRFRYISKDNAPCWILECCDSATSARARLLIDQKTLREQHQRMKSGKTHGFSLLLRDLMRNAVALAQQLPENPEPASKKLFYPGIFDLAGDVRQHYNEKVDRFKAQDQSEAGGVRKYNNLIKSVIINEFVNASRSPRDAGAPCILDLACGHGQDLQKYAKKFPRLYIGVDISDAALKEAQRRHTDMRQRYPARFLQGNLLMAQTFEEIRRTADIFGVTGTGGLFDTVSMQLSLHYLIGTREGAKSLVQMISGLLKPGGRFIATFPCCERIAGRMRGLHKSAAIVEGTPIFEFGNDLYRVKIPLASLARIVPSLTDTLKPDASDEELESLVEALDIDEVSERLSTEWGIPYSFWLIETIDDQEEYVVPLKELVAVMDECGLDVALSGNFAEILQQYNHSPVIAGFNKTNNGLTLSPNEEEIFRFYRTLVAQKR